MIFEEKRISSQRIYEGAILNLRRDTVTVPGGTAYREIVEHNGAVAIVPITKEGKLVMVKQFRYPSGKVLLEIPAGKIDKGETNPEETARRELKEETGLRGEMKEIGRAVRHDHHSFYVVYLCEADFKKDSIVLQEGETIGYK